MKQVTDLPPRHLIMGKPGPKAWIAGSVVSSLAGLDSVERAKLIRQPRLAFLERRLRDEPQSLDARWK